MLNTPGDLRDLDFRRASSSSHWMEKARHNEQRDGPASGRWMHSLKAEGLYACDHVTHSRLQGLTQHL